MLRWCSKITRCIRTCQLTKISPLAANKKMSTSRDGQTRKCDYGTARVDGLPCAPAEGTFRGQRQRVLGRAIVRRPGVYLFDLP